MAEKKDKKDEAAAAAPAEGAAAKSPAAQKKREEKVSRWTLAVCKKAARRFATAEDWKVGAPSSFKAAESKGWVAECVKGMTGAKPAPKKTSAPKPTSRGRAA